MPVFGGSGGQTTSTRTIWANQPQCPPKTCYKSGPIVQAAPTVPVNYYSIVDNGNTITWHVGEGVHRIQKIAGAADYDAGAVSTAGAAGDFVIRLRPITTSGANAYGAGANSDPLTNNYYDTIDFLALYVPGGNTWSIYENGVNQLSALANSTYFWIWRTGTTLGYGRGATLGAAQAAPDRTTTNSATLYFDSTFWSIADEMEALFYDVTTVAYSLTADFLSFAFNPQAALLEQGYDMLAAAASYTFSPQSANSLKSFAVDAASYAFSPQSVLSQSTMIAGAVSYSFSPQAANLLQSLAAAAASFAFNPQTILSRSTMIALASSYAFNPQNALLEQGYAMPVGAASYSFNPQAVGVPLSLSAGAASYSFNPQAGALALTLRMVADAASYSFSPQAVRYLLGYGSIPPPSGGTVRPRVVASFL